MNAYLRRDRDVPFDSQPSRARFVDGEGETENLRDVLPRKCMSSVGSEASSRCCETGKKDIRKSLSK